MWVPGSWFEISNTPAWRRGACATSMKKCPHRPLPRPTGASRDWQKNENEAHGDRSSLADALVHGTNGASVRSRRIPEDTM